MILYVNGDSHTAAAEAVNNYAFACDDGNYLSMGREPHPNNFAVSYGAHLAKKLNAQIYCDAESASSNCRIVRTTLNHLETHTPDLIVIGWSTWEREEWLHDGIYWQINAGPPGKDWPIEFQERYKEWVINIDWNKCQEHWHQTIYEMHELLNDKRIKHLFFNCYEPFTSRPQYDWGSGFVQPYNKDFTYFNWLKNNGFNTVNPNSYHYGPDAHLAWSQFLEKQL